MSKETVFTMKLEPALRAESMAEAAREFYDQYFHCKVAASRVSMHAGRGRSNEEVEAAFAARRAAASQA